MILNQFYDRNDILITQLKCDNCPKQTIIRLTMKEIYERKILWSNLPRDWKMTDQGIICEACYDNTLQVNG